MQFEDPNREGGANKVSLNQAKQNFARIGASDPNHKDKVRQATEEEQA